MADAITKGGMTYVGVGIGVIALEKKQARDESDKVVLTKRNDGANNRSGLWELPGGTLELGETLEEAVIRETEEETGLTVNPLFCCGIYQDFPGKQHWISLTYVADIAGGKLENKEKGKFDEVGLFPLNDLPEPLSALTEIAIRDYMVGKTIPIHEVRE